MPDLITSALVQFGGVTILTMAMAEYFTLPIGIVGAAGLQARKRLNALIYSIPLSFVAYGFGVVQIPEIAEEVLPFGNTWWFRAFVVVFLGLVSVAMAHAAHAVKRAVTDGPNPPE